MQTIKNNGVGERLLTTPRHEAYLKISEGGDRPCSFFAIESTSIENLVRKTKNLAAKATKGLIRMAQNLSYYGLAIY